MRRTAWVVQTLRENGSENSTVWQLMVQHAAVLTILRHAYSDVVPDLSKALEGSTLAKLLLDRNGKPQFPEEIQRFLDIVEFQPEPFDAVIIELLDTGALEKDKLATAIRAAQEKSDERAAEAAYHQFWDELRNGFCSKPVDFVARVKTFLANDQGRAHAARLADLSNLLLDVEPSDENKRLVAAIFTTLFLHTPPSARVASLNRFPALVSAKIHEVIPYEPVNATETLAEIIEGIAGSDLNWDASLYSKLELFTDTEIGDYLTSRNSHHAIFYGKRLLERISITDTSAFKAMHGRIKAILHKIATLSPLHRFQVEFFINEKVPSLPNLGSELKTIPHSPPSG